MDLDSVTDELYGLAREEFVDVREERARQARSAGQRDLASRIQRLRKPTAGAWATNLLVREKTEEIDQLLQLGEQLRRAQTELRGEDLRALSEQRSRVVSALSAEGRRLARDSGHPISDKITREVEGTLEAALADPGAADELRAGRLTSRLSHTGLGPVGTVPQTGDESPGGTRRSTKGRGRSGEGRRGGKKAERAAVARAQKARDDARKHIHRRERALEEAQERASAARSRYEAAEREVADAEKELRRARDVAEAREREWEQASRRQD